MDGVLHTSTVTLSFPAINADEAFESLEVMQLFNSSRDGVTVPGTGVHVARLYKLFRGI